MLIAQPFINHIDWSHRTAKGSRVKRLNSAYIDAFDWTSSSQELHIIRMPISLNL